jgi:predicted DNA-binding transcriptional regulator YafY
MNAIEKLLIILEALHTRPYVDAYDETLLDRLGCSPKQLGRDLQTLESYFEQIVSFKQGKRKAYKLINTVDVLSEAYRNNDLPLGMLFEMAREGMPELFSELETITKEQDGVYIFFNSPLEEIEDFEKTPTFRSLKDAIKRLEYRNIFLKGGKRFINVKPIKLIFSEGNWYVAYIDGDTLRISRISFIDKVTYASKNNYRASDTKPFLTWLKQHYQNPFSRYDTTLHEAILYAKPNIAHYFDEGMKRFFPTQRFIEKTEEGGVRFSVVYTQEKEILPFVRCWMPDLVIEVPQSLVAAHFSILKTSIRNYES